MMQRIWLICLLLVISLPISFAMAEQVTINNGSVKLRAILQKSSEDWLSNPIIVMTHGTLAHNEMEIMVTLQDMLLERGLSSLSINLSLGISDRSGMYDCATTHTHRHTDAVAEIGVWVDWLQQKGAQSIVLLGHSRGGNQTARYAALNDEKDIIRGTVLVAPAVWDQKSAEENYKKNYSKPLQPILHEAEQLVANGKGDTVMKNIDFIYCPNTSATAASFVSYYRPDPLMNTPTVLQSITKPLLVFIGTHDPIIQKLRPGMADLIQQNNISMEVVEGADHYFRDLYSEDISDMIYDFISSIE